MPEATIGNHAAKMRTLKTILLKHKKLVQLVCLVLFCFIDLPAFPQIQSVTTVQNMSFGAFSQGSSGGTIIISNTGSRSVTGTIVPLNLGSLYFQAIFEVEAVEGTVVSISNGPDATLNGSNGGTMTLQIGNAVPGSPFINTLAPPGRTQVKIGGTLIVGNPATSPPGSYSGTLFITFNNE